MYAHYSIWETLLRSCILEKWNFLCINKTSIRNKTIPPENLVFVDLQWFSFSPRCSVVKVYSRTPQYHCWVWLQVQPSTLLTILISDTLCDQRWNRLEVFNQRGECVKSFIIWMWNIKYKKVSWVCSVASNMLIGYRCWISLKLQWTVFLILTINLMTPGSDKGLALQH